MERPTDDGGLDPGEGSSAGSGAVRVRRYRGRRAFMTVGIGLLILLLVALAGLWIARRPLATEFLEREFERRAVDATYRIDRVGLRTQQVSNLVIGDPQRPDLTARFAQIQTHIKWNGSVEIYRVVARGVRLRGRVIDGRVSWGQIDKLLPPPTDKPFELPNFVLDVADSSISLATPYGPLGMALEGSGNLSGGFEGRMAAASPRLDLGRCEIIGLDANVAIEVKARRPRVDGPLAVDRLTCPQSRFQMIGPRLDINSRFNESFTRYEGRGRMAIPTLTAGGNGLAAFVGDLTFRGDPSATLGTVKLAAQRSRLATVSAERTRLNGRYRLGITGGTFAFVGDYAANGATLDPGMLASITGPLAAAENTPVGPVATAIGAAIGRTVRNFDVDGEIRLVNFAGGGGARIESAEVTGPAGARVRISGGDGVSYYWPSGRMRIDGLIQTSGGGLPTGRIAMRQPRIGAPLSGVAEFAPYTARGSRLAMAPIRFSARPDGSTEISTEARVDGAFPDGQVRGLRLPINARLGANGGFTMGRSCIAASVEYLRFRELQIGPTQLPICPAGQPAIISQAPGGSLHIGARVANPVLQGRLGDTPLRVTAQSARIVDDKEFRLTGAVMRLGDPDSPILVEADRVLGTFRGSGVSGTLSNAEAVIGNVPLLIRDANAKWRVYHGDLAIDGELMLHDRAEEPRFYPLRSRDFRFVLAGNDIRAGGTLQHPDTGIKVTDVAIEHDLATGGGHAQLDVPGITFGQSLQPEELTRLTEGVVALVEGSVSGQGRIDWGRDGEATSSGEFTTVNMDLAAPFGPVTDLTTTIRFTDLLALETAPGQTATAGSINPGILVEDGVITYQLLPDQLVRVERGVWPFMGGSLLLQETILNFNRPSAKRLTFQVDGFNAKTFIDSLGFEGIMITGTFDGVLPMIFDESGGRLVGGRLDSRPPGGEFRYTGTKPDTGLVGGVAFDLLSNIRYRSMIIRLDGDLAGEFASRFTINEISLGNEGGFLAGLARGAFSKVPLRLNLNIRGPFRALIQTAKGFKDPTTVIEPVMPFPLDAPGIVTETRTISKEEDQTRTTPADEVKVTPQPPQPSE
ncbi:MAG TPA: YdbH domain-containing protein [Sphingomicrobium sp.]|nr:YdbH domain-containing protein [Sphingomicrobium sp.]